MEPDYPAAHSMDTFWYAVDKEGHVGVFFTGENGHLPSVPAGPFQDTDLMEFVRQLRGGAPRGDDEEEDEDEEFDWDAVVGEAAERGLFVYEYDEEELPVAAPYGIMAEPKAPLHADQLPPRLRKLCKQVRFDKVTFPGSEHVQPAEHVKCDFWSDEEVAYLASDGKTIRPLPGKEKRFADFVAEFRNDFPKEAKKFRFEGGEDRPAPPKRPRKKGGGDGS
jgi:hypothetical protein